jgi:beta-N-acetylhexosaminidase
MTQSLTSLPLEQQIGQLFFIGLPGMELDTETRELLEYVKPGGVIIFGRNVGTAEQLRSLLDDVRSLLPTPPLIGIDQEGGLVDRLRRICTPMPAARTIRQHGDLAAARALGRITGEVLRLLGFNINFAPVMSIMTDERDLLSNGLLALLRALARRSARLHDGLSSCFAGHGLPGLSQTFSRHRRGRG